MTHTIPRLKIGALSLATLAMTSATASAAQFGVCGPYVQELISWVNSNPDPSTERYVWFVLVSNQARTKQVVAYVHGRLLPENCPAGCVSGQGKTYLINQNYLESNGQHKLTSAFKPLPAEPPKWYEPGPLTKLKLDAGNPGTMYLSGGVQVSQTQCYDDVMYGWEDVPAGQNPQTYPKTLFTVSFNKMTAAKSQPNKNAVEAPVSGTLPDPIPKVRPQRVPSPN